jgi:hypothetical protein
MLKTIYQNAWHHIPQDHKSTQEVSLWYLALVSSHWKAHLPVCGCCWIKVHVCFICSTPSHLVNSQNPWSLRPTTCRGPFTVHTSLTHATLPLTAQKVTVPELTNKEMVKFYLAHHPTNQIKDSTSTRIVESAAIFRFWHKSLTHWTEHTRMEFYLYFCLILMSYLILCGKEIIVYAFTVMWCMIVQLHKHHAMNTYGQLHVVPHTNMGQVAQSV